MPAPASAARPCYSRLRGTRRPHPFFSSLLGLASRCSATAVPCYVRPAYLLHIFGNRRKSNAIPSDFPVDGAFRGDGSGGVSDPGDPAAVGRVFRLLNRHFGGTAECVPRGDGFVEPSNQRSRRLDCGSIAGRDDLERLVPRLSSNRGELRPSSHAGLPHPAPGQRRDV